jgi:hypothetical protein
MRIVTWPVVALKSGDNTRTDLGTDEELRQLAKSLEAAHVRPVYITPDGTVLDRRDLRRVAAARLAGILSLSCIVSEE